jgi:hypothetical protein
VGLSSHQILEAEQIVISIHPIQTVSGSKKRAGGE